MLFGAAVRVYDRNRQCLLCNGQYQIVLTDLQSYETLPGRTASWLSVTDPQVCSSGIMVSFHWHLGRWHGKNLETSSLILVMHIGNISVKKNF